MGKLIGFESGLSVEQDDLQAIGLMRNLVRSGRQVSFTPMILSLFQRLLGGVEILHPVELIPGGSWCFVAGTRRALHRVDECLGNSQEIGGGGAECRGHRQPLASARP